MTCVWFQCNNPLTKEPKLTAAQRIVPEWTTYDNEIKAVWDKIYKKTNKKKDTESSSTEGKHPCGHTH